MDALNACHQSGNENERDADSSSIPSELGSLEHPHRDEGAVESAEVVIGDAAEEGRSQDGDCGKDTGVREADSRC